MFVQNFIKLSAAGYLSVNSPDLLFELFFATYFSLGLGLGLALTLPPNPNPMNMMMNMMLMSKNNSKHKSGELTDNHMQRFMSYQQTCARFRTTLDFDREYLWNGSCNRQADVVR